jgi:hypothetical protein
VALKRAGQEKGGLGRGRDTEATVFVTLVHVWAYFCCSSGCVCQGLQEAGVVYSWYRRLVSEL